MTTESQKCEPAASLIARLGGPSAVVRFVRLHAIEPDGDRRTRGMHVSTVLRWSMSVEQNGTGGCIPVKYWPALIKAARSQGIEITMRDLNARVANAFEELKCQV